MAPGEAETDFVISRTFDAPRDLVWKARTEAERLAKWWRPGGATIRVIKFDFTPGGIFHYAMSFQPGHDTYGRFVHREIEAPSRLVFVSSFSDAEGGVTRAPFPQLGATWPLEVLNEMTLTEQDDRTTLTIRGRPIDPTDEEHKTFRANVESMRQAFGDTLDKLAQYLASA